MNGERLNKADLFIIRPAQKDRIACRQDIGGGIDLLHAESSTDLSQKEAGKSQTALCRRSERPTGISRAHEVYDDLRCHSPTQPNPNTHKLGGALTSSFGDANVLSLEDDKGWLLSADGAAPQISEKLGVTSGVNGGAVIIEMASYFGRANPIIWSWLKNKLEPAGRG